MKKTVLIILTLFILCSCQSDSSFQSYRSNPFLFPYPEYHFKADSIDIEPIPIKKNSAVVDLKQIPIRFGTNTKDSLEVIEKPGSSYQIKGINNMLFLVRLEKEKYMGCAGKSKEIAKDLCSAFDSSKDYFTKLYTLTPDDLSKEQYAPLGNDWIVHHKGSWFKDVSDIYIYKSSKFIAFRRDFRLESKLKSEILIFHDKISPNYISMAFDLIDENLIENILKTIE